MANNQESFVSMEQSRALLGWVNSYSMPAELLQLFLFEAGVTSEACEHAIKMLSFDLDIAPPPQQLELDLGVG